MMMRILSILPAIVAFLCTIILLVSVVGYNPPSTRIEAPIVPCDQDISCPVGMNDADLSIPSAFMLLDIKLEISWDEPNRGWIGVVDSKVVEFCPPDSNGLTDCDSSEFEEYLVAGGPDSTGKLTFHGEPGNYRFITGGKDGSSLSSQFVIIDASVHLNYYVQIFLFISTIILFIGAGEMAFPLKRLWKKFRDG